MKDDTALLRQALGALENSAVKHPQQIDGKNAAAVQDLVTALMIIAGKQRCVDSLMSNVDIALEALKKWEGK